ncbi:lytic murein transglycosylase [bacterium]|nr:lytic murein transglycosylase [bacterium]
MRLPLLALLALTASPAVSAPCGGDFQSFLAAMASEAKAQGLPDSAIHAFLDKAQIDPAVLRADHGQGVFRKTFLDFSQSLISKGRIQNAALYSKKYNAVFAAAEKKYGVSRGIILAFWAFETDFGQVQGNFDTRNALVTLAHDCRRPDVFQPQVLAAIALTAKGDFQPGKTIGAWAGEIGMIQMLPRDILERGADGDGDGLISLKTSAPDAIMSAARMLQFYGWQAGQPWLQEVSVPQDLDWSQSGLDTALPTSQWAAMGVKPRQGKLANLPASLLLPQGRKGPAFLVYENYKVLFNWNKSFVYVTTAAYFASRIEGAPPYVPGTPDPALSGDQMTSLQKKLTQRGHDVGKIDGVLGALTRVAVQAEQKRLGLPADGWPTADLLARL